jgi:hypothetical protein
LGQKIFTQINGGLKETGRGEKQPKCKEKKGGDLVI